MINTIKTSNGFRQLDDYQVKKDDYGYRNKKRFGWKPTPHNKTIKGTTYYNDTYTGTIDDKGNVSLTRHAGGCKDYEYETTEYSFYRDYKNESHLKRLTDYENAYYKIETILCFLLTIIGGLMFLSIFALRAVEGNEAATRIISTIASIGIGLALYGGYSFFARAKDWQTLLLRLITLPWRIRAFIK